MSFLYRHLVNPDLAPPPCKSNNFLFYGGTVTNRCQRAHHPQKHEPPEVRLFFDSSTERRELQIAPRQFVK
jgi:hypothetical protein